LIKKAMAFVTKLDGKVVNPGKNHQVLGYASGKNHAYFIQFIDNGIYALSLKEGKRSNLDKDDSDGDNEVIGKVVRNTAEGMPIHLVDVNDDDMEKGDDDDQEVVEHSLDSWNSWNSVDAPEGYCFFGKLSFLCLGPASEYYSEILSSTGSQVTVTAVEDKKLMDRAAMLKEVSAQATVNRDVGGSDRGISLATMASFGDGAEQR
jgi:hypothetical protein